MRECVERISNTSLSEDDRITAFDELELLVESLDNANDLRPLGLWAPIIGMLSSELSSMRMYAAWVLGTAVQNNPQAQKDFLDAGGLEPVLGVLENDSDSEVRTKAFYCVSSAIRHNTTLFKAFHAANGFRVVVSALQNADPALLRRTVFFWKTLLETDASNGGVLDADAADADAVRTIADLAAAAMSEHGVATMVMHLGEAVDLDLTEKCIELLDTFARRFPTAIDADTLSAISSSFVPKVEARLDAMHKADAEDVGEAKAMLARLSEAVAAAKSS
ncbi:hsp70 nucleotide exchange factor fes1 [Polyrhizophydium stewartii]|uniref:Hsp70 nucleotide exchange factor fes1 n=1 Tax=Polyrhizophydium stewartii TaxID=2732419 RepID=A0ABR4NK51_9FUNG